MGDVLADAAERVVQAKGQELVRVIGREVLALVRAKVGEKVGDALGEYVRALKESVDERLAVRLNGALDTTAVELVAALAGEVLHRIDEDAAVIALDAGERMASADSRVLSDLTHALPHGIQLRVAFATYSAEHRATVDFLKDRGNEVDEVALRGLNEDAVRSWLVQARLDADLAPRVVRVTDGYPLHIGDLISHLTHGGAVDDAPLHEAFARRTEEAWSQLDARTARHARRLCVFTDPLPDDRTRAFLGLDPAEWGEAQERLSRARIFSGEVNGIPWFHEQRRRYLTEVKLTGEERAEASADAVLILREMIVASKRPERIAELADLVTRATRLLQADEQLQGALALSRAQLGLCAALVELMEPKMQLPAVGGDELLRYTQQVFDVPGDLVEAFRDLAACPFVHVEERGSAAVAVPYWRDLLVILVISGRAEREFGRSVVPAAAGAVFDSEIFPSLGHFYVAGYGAGYASMASLAEEAIANRARHSGRHWTRYADPEPNLLVRGRYAGRPIYAHVCFHASEDRDMAHKSLDGTRGEVLGQEFEVFDVVPHPLHAVAVRRFLLAAKRLLRETVSIDYDGTRGARELETAIDAEERLRRRAAALRCIRERSGPDERYATNLEEPVGFVYSGDANRLEVLEVSGGREGVRRIEIPMRLAEDHAFFRYRLAQVADLDPGERPGHYQVQLSRAPRRSDPAMELLSDLADRAKRYNVVQPRLELALNTEDLATRIQAGLHTQLNDARALAACGAFGDLPDVDVPALAYEIDLLTPTKDQFQVPRWRAHVATKLAYSDGDQVALRLHNANGARLRTSEELEIEGFLSWSVGPADHAVAELCGYRSEDVLLLDS